MARKTTIKTLTSERDALQKRLNELLIELGTLRSARSDAEKEVRVARVEHQDLKRRILTLTEDNARMLGYIQRCQEDDVVREELVKTGSEEMGWSLVPIRKPTSFSSVLAQSDYNSMRGDGALEEHPYDRGEMRRALNKKGWVNY